MRVAVTGHHGYVGSVLVPVLQTAGHSVVGFDTFYYEACTFGHGRLEPSEAVSRDVRDMAAADLGGFDAVVHLAALSNDPIGDLNAAWTYSINRDGAVRVALAAKEAGVPRFVFASSCSMYGAADGGAVLDESAALCPLTPYAESKVQAEERLLELSDPSFAVVSMRNATVYGASPRLRLDVVVNNLVAAAHTTGKITLQSDGSSWRPLIHVIDLARATLAMLEAPSELVAGEAFNVGSADQNYRIRDLAETVHERLPACDVTFAEGASTDPRSYRVDFEKFESAFPNFTFQWTARRSVDELARAFAEVGLTADDFSARFVRLAELRRLLDAGDLDHDLRWRTTATPTAGRAEPLVEAAR